MADWDYFVSEVPSGKWSLVESGTFRVLAVLGTQADAVVLGERIRAAVSPLSADRRKQENPPRV